MLSTTQENVTTKEAILNTIEVDPQTNRWFTFLAHHPDVRETLSVQPQADSLFQQLKKKSQQQMFASISLLIPLILFLITKIYFSLILLIVPFILLKIILKQQKSIVKKVCLALLAVDFPDENILKRTSLYQIGEFYSRKYNIPSIVDTIFVLDNITRKALLAAFVIMAIVLPYYPNIFSYLLSIFLIVAAANFIAKSSWFYKRIR